NYSHTQDMVLALEAYRMVGLSNNKYGNTDGACKALASALQLCKHLPVETLRFSTFPGVIELLLGLNHSKYISQEEVEAVSRSVYGEDWMKEIQNWKNPNYQSVNDPAVEVHL